MIPEPAFNPEYLVKIPKRSLHNYGLHLTASSGYLLMTGDKVEYGIISKYLSFIMFSFLQRKCHPLTRCIKNIADQPCYNVIFYMSRTEHKY